MNRVTRDALRYTLLTLVLGLGATGCNRDCEDAGRGFNNGDHWVCSDGCNHCWCTDGTISSTRVGCESPPGPNAGKLYCSYYGELVSHGTHWNCNWSSDGPCLTCTCDDGDVSQETCKP